MLLTSCMTSLLFFINFDTPPPEPMKVVDSLAEIPSGWDFWGTPQPTNNIHFKLELPQDRPESELELVAKMTSPDDLAFRPYITLAELPNRNKKAEGTVRAWLSTHGAENVEGKGFGLEFDLNIEQAVAMMNTTYGVYLPKGCAVAAHTVFRTMKYSVPESVSGYVKSIQPTTEFPGMSDDVYHHEILSNLIQPSTVYPTPTTPDAGSPPVPGIRRREVIHPNNLPPVMNKGAASGDGNASPNNGAQASGLPNRRAVYPRASTGPVQKRFPIPSDAPRGHQVEGGAAYPLPTGPTKRDPWDWNSNKRDVKPAATGAAKVHPNQIRARGRQPIPSGAEKVHHMGERAAYPMPTNLTKRDQISHEAAHPQPSNLTKRDVNGHKAAHPQPSNFMKRDQGADKAAHPQPTGRASSPLYRRLSLDGVPLKREIDNGHPQAFGFTNSPSYHSLTPRARNGVPALPVPVSSGTPTTPDDLQTPQED